MGPFFPIPFSFSFSLFLFLSLCSYRTANVPDSTALSSTLLRSNLVEFSWLDILLSSRAYLYLAFESSGPFARFANCTVALTFYALHEKERKRDGERDSPSFPNRDGGLSLYFGFGRLTEDAEDPYPLRRGIRETESTGKSLCLSHPSGTHGRARAPLLIYIGRLAYFVIYC